MTDWKVEQDEMWQRVADRDESSKIEGKIVGRYIQEQIADGYAYYLVFAISPKDETAILIHIPYMDGYTVPMIESMHRKVPLKYVKENITHRDRLAGMFARRDADNALDFG